MKLTVAVGGLGVGLSADRTRVLVAVGPDEVGVRGAEVGKKLGKVGVGVGRPAAGWVGVSGGVSD